MVTSAQIEARDAVREAANKAGAARAAKAKLAADKKRQQQSNRVTRPGMTPAQIEAEDKRKVAVLAAGAKKRAAEYKASAAGHLAKGTSSPITNPVWNALHVSNIEALRTLRMRQQDVRYDPKVRTAKLVTGANKALDEAYVKRMDRLAAPAIKKAKNKAILEEAYKHPADISHGADLERLYRETLADFKSGAPLDIEMLDKLDKAYQSHVTRTSQQYNQIVDELLPFYKTGADGKLVYKSKEAEAAVSAIMKRTNFAQVQDELRRLSGDGRVANGQQESAYERKVQNGAYNPVVSGGSLIPTTQARDQIAVIQRQRLYDIAKMTVFNKTQHYRGVGGSSAADPIRASWRDEKYLYDAYKETMDPTKTGIKYKYDSATNSVVGTRRTIEEEFEFKRAQYIAGLQEQYAKWENQKLRYNRMGPNNGNIHLASDLAMLKDAARSVGLTKSPRTQKEIQDTVNAAMVLWEKENAHFFPKGGSVNGVDPGFAKARDEAKNRLYAQFGAAEKPWWERPLEDSSPGEQLGQFIWQNTMGMGVRAVDKGFKIINSTFGLTASGANAIPTMLEGKPTALLFSEGNLTYDKFPPYIQQKINAELQRMLASEDFQTGQAAVIQRGGKDYADVVAEMKKIATQNIGQPWIEKTAQGQEWAGQNNLLTSGTGWTTGRNPVERTELYNNLKKFSENFYTGKDMLQALNDQTTEAFTKDSSALMLAAGLFLDPGNVIPMNFLTYLNRLKYAAVVTKDMSLAGKRLPIFAKKWLTVSEMELKLEKDFGKFATRLTGGEDPAIIKNEILQALMGVTGKSQRERATKRLFQKWGINPRDANEHQLFARVEEIYVANLRNAGVDYRSVGDEARALEYEKSVKEAAAKAEDKKMAAAKAERMKREAQAQRELEAKIAGLPEKEAQIERLKAQRERIFQQRKDRAMETPKHVEPPKSPFRVEAEPVKPHVHAPEQTVDDFATTTPHVDPVPVIQQATVKRRKVVTERRVLAEKPGRPDAPKITKATKVIPPSADEAHQPFPRAGGTVVTDFGPETYRNPTLINRRFVDHGRAGGVENVYGAFFPRGYVQKFRESEVGRALLADIESLEPNTHALRAPWRARREKAFAALHEEGRRAMAKKIADKEGNVTQLSETGHLQFARRAVKHSTSGETSFKQYVPNSFDAQTRSGLKTNDEWAEFNEHVIHVVEKMKRDILTLQKKRDRGAITWPEYRVQSEKVLSESTVMVRGYEIKIGDQFYYDMMGDNVLLSTEDAILYRREVLEVRGMLSRLEDEMNYKRETFDVRRAAIQKMVPKKGATAEDKAALRVEQNRLMFEVQVDQMEFMADYNQRRRNMIQHEKDIMATSPRAPIRVDGTGGQLKGYYQTFSLLPEYDETTGKIADFIGDAILDPTVRRGLDEYQLIDILKKEYSEAPYGPLQFKEKGQWLFALFHMTMLDAAATGSMERMESYRRVFTLLLNANEENTWGNMWRVMETRAGLPGADSFSVADEAFIHSILVGGGSLVTIHPNMALQMIPYGPFARNVPVRYGHAHLLEDIQWHPNRLFETAGTAMDDKVVLDEINEIASNVNIKPEEGVRISTRILDYVANRFGNPGTKESFNFRLNDHSLFRAFKDQRTGETLLEDGKVLSPRADAMTKLREEYIAVRMEETPPGTMPDIPVHYQGSDNPGEMGLPWERGKGDARSPETRAKEALGREFDEMFTVRAAKLISKGNAPEFTKTLRDLYMRRYWRNEITHDNAGLHTLTLLLALQDPEYQVGRQWQNLYRSYRLHMKAAGQDALGEEVGNIVFRRQRIGMAQDAYQRRFPGAPFDMNDVLTGNMARGSDDEVAMADLLGRKADDSMVAGTDVFEEFGLGVNYDAAAAQERQSRVIDFATEQQMRQAEHDEWAAGGPRYGEPSNAAHYVDSSIAEVEENIDRALAQLDEDVPRLEGMEALDAGNTLLQEADHAEHFPLTGKALEKFEEEVAALRALFDFELGVTATPVYNKRGDYLYTKREGSRLLGTADVKNAFANIRKHNAVVARRVEIDVARDTAISQVYAGLNALVRRTMDMTGLSDEAEETMVRIIKKVEALPDGRRMLNGLANTTGEGVLQSRAGQYLQYHGYFWAEAKSPAKMKYLASAVDDGIARAKRRWASSGFNPAGLRPDRAGEVAGRFEDQAAVAARHPGSPVIPIEDAPAPLMPAKDINAQGRAERNVRVSAAMAEDEVKAKAAADARAFVKEVPQYNVKPPKTARVVEIDTSKTVAGPIAIEPPMIAIEKVATEKVLQAKRRLAFAIDEDGAAAAADAMEQAVLELPKANELRQDVLAVVEETRAHLAGENPIQAANNAADATIPGTPERAAAAQKMIDENLKATDAMGGTRESGGASLPEPPKGGELDRAAREGRAPSYLDMTKEEDAFYDDYMPDPDYVGRWIKRTEPLPMQSVMDKLTEAMGVAPIAPHADDIQTVEIGKAEKMMEILAGVSEEDWLLREKAKAQRAVRGARTHSQRRAAWDRLRRVAAAERVQQIAKGHQSYAGYASRRTFANRAAYIGRDRIVAAFSPKRICSYFSTPEAIPVEQGREYRVVRQNSVVGKGIGKIRRAEGVSIHYKRNGKRLDRIFSGSIANVTLERLGINTKLAGPLSALDLLAHRAELGAALKRPGFERFMDDLEIKMEQKLKAVARNKEYTLAEYLADRSVGRPDHFNIKDYAAADRVVSDAVHTDRGYTRRTYTDLPYRSQGEKLEDVSDDAEPIVEATDRALGDVFAKMRALKSIGVDPHEYNEARMVLRSGHVKTIAARKIQKRTMTAVLKELEDAGVKIDDKAAWDKAFRESWDKHFDVYRGIEAETEAMGKFRELAGGTMMDKPVDEIVAEFERMYGYSNEVVQGKPRIITEFQAKTLDEAQKTLLGIDDLDDEYQLVEGLARFGQSPSMLHRKSRREWLVKYGFFSPRTKEAIESGHKSWDIYEEAKWFRDRWGAVPPDCDPDLYIEGGVREGVAHVERDYIDTMIADGVYEQNMGSKYAQGGMTKEERIKLIVYGDEKLGIKPSRDLELERRYVFERYGSLYSREDADGAKVLTAFPWLMNHDELSEYFVTRAQKGVAADLIQNESELNVVDDLIKKHIQQFVDEAVLAGKPVTHEDVMNVAVDTVAELLRDPVWMKRRRDALGDTIRLQGKIRRGLVMTMFGFGSTNVIDSGIRNGYVRWRDRSFILSGAAHRSAFAEGLTLRHAGMDQTTQLVRDASRPLGTSRMKEAAKGFWDPNEDPILDLISGAATIPMQASAAAERMAKLNLLKDMYDPVYELALKRLGDPELARVAALKMCGDRIKRMWPTVGTGSLERLMNELSPFMSYQFKNHVLFIGEVAKHPSIYLWLDRIGKYIEQNNVANWEKTHLKGTMPDRLKRLIELPWAPGEFIDLGQFTDFQRGVKPLYMASDEKTTVAQMVSQFVRLCSASDQNIASGIMNYFHINQRIGWREIYEDGFPTGRWEQVEMPQQAPWGGDANALNSLWPVQLGADLIAAGGLGGLSVTSATRLAWRTLFMGGTYSYDEGAGLNRYYMTLRDQSKYSAEQFLLTTEGQKLQIWWDAQREKPNMFKFPRSLDDAMDPNLHIDPNPWFHAKSKEYQAHINMLLDAKRALNKKWDKRIWELVDDPEAQRQAKLEASTAFYDFYQKNPSLYEYEAFSMTDEEWAKQTDDWATDALVSSFFKMVAPVRDDPQFKTQDQFDKALATYEKSKVSFLQAFPKAAAVIQGSKDALSGIRSVHEQRWFDVLDEIGTRDIAIEAAREKDNFPLVEQLYIANELQYDKLNLSQAASYWNPVTDMKQITDLTGRKMTTVIDGLVPRMTIMPNFSKWRWDRADAEKKKKIMDDQRYSDGMSVVAAKVKGEKDPDKAGMVFVRELRKDPWLLNHYFNQPGNEGKRREWKLTDEYVAAMGKYHDYMVAGHFDKGNAYFNNLPDWMLARYEKAHPGKIAKNKATAAYMGYMGKWVSFYKRRDYAGGASYFEKMPSWVKSRYYANNGKYNPNKYGSGGGGSSPYSRAMGKWVDLLKAGKDAEAKSYFDSMPKAYRDRYYAGHPEQKLRADVKRVGQLAEYFAADDANRAQYLTDNPLFAKWLKAHGSSASQRAMLITVAYQSIPKDNEWLRRVFREQYPEVFSVEAKGEATLKRIYTTLAAHPDMVPSFEKWVAAIWASYAENAKHTAPRPKPIVWDHSPQSRSRLNRHIGPHEGKSAAWVRIHQVA